ncbi:MAG TPA: MASE1 domain-containing protein [Thermoanaerobaculia bacterium]|jgi:signal transduction histidine kinase/ActR/RegA family two-component response regulator|nr:MASE1 domain-containing protein [Thermoanaerobaculia bacterium]
MVDTLDRGDHNGAPRAVEVLLAAALAATYFVLARAGLRIQAVGGFATLVWPPSGIALAALLAFGPRLWPGIAAGAFLANLATGAPIAVALGIAAGNTGEALFAVWALRRIDGFRPALDRLQDVLGLVLLGGLAAPIVSATAGVASLRLGGILASDAAFAAWRAWWLGDSIAILVLVPLLLTWHREQRSPLASRRLESYALALMLALATLFLFYMSRERLSVLIAPFLIWAAVRFDVRGAARANFLAAAIGIWATIHGRGPFANTSLELGLLRLQATVAATASTFLVLGAMTAERRRADRELRRARDDAEDASRSKDRFLATLSHELRTPLTPVLALSSRLERDRSLPDDARRSLQVIRRNAEHEARLIDDLLDLTRVASGKLEIRSETVSLLAALDDAVDTCRAEALAKGVTLERSLGEDAWIRADPARLRQIVSNIVQNAVKFTPRGGRVTLRRAEAPFGRVALEIADTGSGIDPAELARIFRPFEQAVHGKGGLGLGLAISRNLVEAHGGTLSARSGGADAGAVFRVELPGPAEAPEGAVSGGVAASSSARASAGAAAPRRVLLVEDHADTADAARELLNDISCEVVAAGSLSEALEAAGVQTFDLVLSDLGLPDGSGLDLMRDLRTRYGLRGIALTGFGMEEDIRRSREAGFVDHLVKPITFDRLSRAVERFFADAGRSGGRRA